MLTGVLARMLAGIRRRRRAIIVAIVSVVVTPVVGPPIAVSPVRLPMPIMVGRPAILHWRLPHNRGLHVRLTGSGHGHIGIAPPVVAIGVNLRRDKERTVVLLLRRGRRHYRSYNIASLRIAILGGDAPVVVIFAL